MISRYTVHVDGRHDPIAVRDRLRACLSEWEVVADVHVTAGDGRYDVTVDWDTDHPDWAEECWPMHAADALGHAAERVDGVGDAVAVCHDQPEPTAAVVDASPPRPPYRLPAGDQGGATNGSQIAVDGRSEPDAALTMGEPFQGLSEVDLAREDVPRLLAEVRRLRAHHEHCAWGACGECEDVALERDAAQAEVERLRVRVAALEQTLAERNGATNG